MRVLADLPKTHLHVHLESTIRASTLRELAAVHGVTVPDPPSRFAGFRPFGDYNSLVRRCLRCPADFTRVAEEFCADEAAQGTRYAEVTFTAAAHGERLGRPEMPLESVLEGLAAGQARHGIECRVLLDHSRRRGVSRAWRTLELALRHADHGVLGIGMAGDESYSLSPFAEVCAAARDQGVRLVHHAGENRGPDSIRQALHIGHADRLGHGIRVLEDDDLVGEIRAREIALEVCPSSNVALSVVESWSAHPLRRLRDAGLAVTLNTDIPSILGITLTDEFRHARDVFGWDDPALAELSRNAIEASFASVRTKARVRAEIDEWLSTPSGSARRCGPPR